MVGLGGGEFSVCHIFRHMVLDSLLSKHMSIPDCGVGSRGRLFGYICALGWRLEEIPTELLHYPFNDSIYG